MRKAYEWDFDGSCAPKEDGSDIRFHGQEKFTLGVFQWVPRASGKGLKRGKVVHRIKGDCNNPRSAYEAARAFVAKKNAQNAGMM